MSTEPGSFTSNGSMIVVSNRLPFVLKRNEITGQLERKARLVGLFFLYAEGLNDGCLELTQSRGRTLRGPLGSIVPYYDIRRCRVIAL